MKLHKQYIQLGITSTLLLLITGYALYNFSYDMAFVGLLMLLVSLMPFYLKAAHDVYIPAVFTYGIIIFIFSSVFLGQFGGLYDKWHWYDAFLHFISALVFGLAGFLVLYVYYVHNKLKIPINIILFFAFFFCLGVGGLWEIIEYGIDKSLGTNMQVSSLDDTMMDLLLDGLGGLVSIVMCSLYVSKIKVPIIDTVVKVVTEEIIEENKDVAKAASHEPIAT